MGSHGCESTALAPNNGLNPSQSCQRVFKPHAKPGRKVVEKVKRFEKFQVPLPSLETMQAPLNTQAKPHTVGSENFFLLEIEKSRSKKIITSGSRKGTGSNCPPKAPPKRYPATWGLSGQNQKIQWGIVLSSKTMRFQRVNNLISFIVVCYENTPQKRGYMAPVLVSDLTILFAVVYPTPHVHCRSQSSALGLQRERQGA